MADAIHCFDTATVRFAIFPAGPEGLRFVAEIGEDPLRDLFGASGGGESLVHAYLMNADVINARALARYREAPGHPVVLATSDFELSESGSES